MLIPISTRKTPLKGHLAGMLLESQDVNSGLPDYETQSLPST